MRSLEVVRPRPEWFERLVREAKSPPPAPGGHPEAAELKAVAEWQMDGAAGRAIGVHLYLCDLCRRAVLDFEAARAIGWLSEGRSEADGEDSVCVTSDSGSDTVGGGYSSTNRLESRT